MTDEGLNCPKCSSETEIKGKEQYRVRAYRCARCGFLDSYATETPEKRNLFG